MKIGLVILFINIYLVNGVRLLQLNKKLIGGLDQDGCISGAGYSYCNYTDKCHRFDEPCNKITFLKNNDYSESNDYYEWNYYEL